LSVFGSAMFSDVIFECPKYLPRLSWGLVK
jgi:hypothetical protein